MPKIGREINIRGEITGVNYDQKEFRVTTKDRSYLVVATNKTKVVGRFVGQLPLRSLRMGDQVAVNGRLRDENTIEAKLIRDMSNWKVGLKKRVGVIREISPSSFVFVLAHGKNEKEVTRVKLSPNTKILLIVVKGKKRELTPIKLEDLRVGDKVQVTGVFNKKDKELDATLIVITKKAERPKSIPAPLQPVPKP